MGKAMNHLRDALTTWYYLEVRPRTFYFSFDMLSKNHVCAIGLELGVKYEDWPAILSDRTANAAALRRSRKVPTPPIIPAPVVVAGPRFKIKWLGNISADMYLYSRRWRGFIPPAVLELAEGKALAHLSEIRSGYHDRNRNASSSSPRLRLALTMASIAGEAQSSTVNDIRDHLSTCPIDSTVVLVLHGVEEFTADMRTWEGLYRSWPRLTILVAVIDRYLRLREILGSGGKPAPKDESIP